MGVPKLRIPSVETKIIKRYLRRESRVEESLSEMHRAEGNVR